MTMKTTKVFVVRFTFTDADKAQKAYDQLELMGFFGELMPSGSDSSWKILVHDKDLTALRVATKRLNTRPNTVEIFDPDQPWDLGFQPLVIE